MSKRRTLNLSDAHWRAVRMRAAADGKTVSEVVEAIIDSAVVVGGPILYGDTPEIWQMRNAQEWLAGTAEGHEAMQKFLREIQSTWDQDHPPKP